MLPIEQEMVRCPGCALESLAVGGLDGPGRFYFSMVCPGCGLGFDDETVAGSEKGKVISEKGAEPGSAPRCCSAE